MDEAVLSIVFVNSYFIGSFRLMFRDWGEPQAHVETIKFLACLGYTIKNNEPSRLYLIWRPCHFQCYIGKPSLSRIATVNS